MNENILIVEDNKTLANLIANKLQTLLEIEVDVAYSFKEAKLFLSHGHYFITLLDINLPDAPHGEVVDYAIEKKNHIIVLSGNTDKEFRASMLKKRIIDYIDKNSANDASYIDYTVHTIQRLRKNRKHKVLVVDDSLVFRKQMQNMLENLFFEVIAVSHGEEALGMLSTKPDIALVITDYNMPVMDGFELTLKIRETYTKDELCILALSGNNDDTVSSLFLKHGANDYINKPFFKEEFSCRVNNSIEALENIQKITQYANRDYLTGLYNRRYFYRHVQEYIKQTCEDDKKLAVAMIDIDHFKKVNDTYGHDVGDKVIVALADILRSGTNPNDIVARFGGEEFCIVLKDIDRNSTAEIFERIRQTVEKFSLETAEQTDVKFTISIGAVLHDLAETLDDSVNAADMLLYKAKKSGRNCLIFKES